MSTLNSPPQSFPSHHRDKLSFLFPVLAIILSSTFVWATFLFSQQEQRYSLSPDSFTKLDPTILKPVTPEELAQETAYYETSKITTVTPDLIAEKTDPNRKLITAKTPADIEAISAIVEQAGGTIIDTNTTTVVAEFPEAETENLNSQLAASETVASIDTDVPAFVLGETDTWNLAKIEAPRAWQVTTGQGIKIGVIDTGVDYTHAELAAHYAGGYDSVNEDTDPQDGHGHGTHVAGIIASNLNGAGVAGVAPEANLYAYKALADSGVGYVSDLVESLDRAIADGVQVINMSVGTSEPVSALENKVNEAANRGITIVAAAGNTNGGAVMYPAAYSSVLSVGATDENDQLASFSSLGGDIVAPGVNIISTLPGGSYGTMSGTSMAAPHVAASAALLLASGVTNPKQTLLASANDLGSTGPDGIYGYGLLQTGESVAPSSPSPTPSPSLEPSPATDESTMDEASDSAEATKSARRGGKLDEDASDSAAIRRRSGFSPTPRTSAPTSERFFSRETGQTDLAFRTIYRVIEEIFKNRTTRSIFDSDRYPQVSPSPSPSPTATPSATPTITPSPSPTLNPTPSPNLEQTNRAQQGTSAQPAPANQTTGGNTSSDGSTSNQPTNQPTTPPATSTETESSSDQTNSGGSRGQSENSVRGWESNGKSGKVRGWSDEQKPPSAWIKAVWEMLKLIFL